MKATIEQIKKSQNPPEKDAYYAVIFGRKISPYFTWVLLRMSVGPNLTTFISLLFILAGAYFFTFPGPQYWLLGWILLQGYHILDSSDGEIARINKTTSKFGGAFDSVLHPLGNSIIFAAASIGIYELTNNIFSLYIGFIAVILLLMLSVVRLHGDIMFSSLGKKKPDSSEHYKNRQTLKGKVFELFTDVGGPFHMLALAAAFDFITGLDFRIYFYALFTAGVFVLLARKFVSIKRNS